MGEGVAGDVIEIFKVLKIKLKIGRESKFDMEIAKITTRVWGEAVADDVIENYTWIVKRRGMLPPEITPLSDLIPLSNSGLHTTRLDYPLRVRGRKTETGYDIFTIYFS